MCCNFENGNGNRPEMSAVPRSSSRQIEQPVDELILFTNIIAADPPRLPLPDHVHRFVSLNRSPGSLELAKALLGLHASFDRSMILLQDVIQILDRPMSAAAAQGSFLGIACCGLIVRSRRQGKKE